MLQVFFLTSLTDHPLYILGPLPSSLPPLGHFSHDFTLPPLQTCSFIFSEHQVRPEMEASSCPRTQAGCPPSHWTQYSTRWRGLCKKIHPKAPLSLPPLLAQSLRWGSPPVAPAIFPPGVLAKRAAFFPGSTACLFKGLITAA